MNHITRSHDSAGIFTADYAIERLQRGRWVCDAGLCRALRDWAGGQRFFDFGAGVGRYCRELDCSGVDGIPGIAELSRGRVQEGNLADPQLTVPPHDIALCLEVAEHLPPSATGILLDHLTRHSDWVIISWAPPTQPGTGHVNGRSRLEVQRLFGERDWLDDVSLTDRLRRAARVSWLRCNLLAFRRRCGRPGGSMAEGA